VARRRRAVSIAACTTPLPALHASEPGDVVLRTLPPESGQTPAACMAALLTGSLVRHPQSGVGLTYTDGKVVAVMWPFGYFARDDRGPLAVIDGAGTVLAHEGDLARSLVASSATKARGSGVVGSPPR
jgi:hypothetical protein